MTVVHFWLRLDLRRRWRSFAVLALLVGVAAATVLTAFAGARRGASSLTRLQESTSPATTVVLPNQPGFDWNWIRSLPQVEAVTTFLNRYSFFFDGISHDFGIAGPAQEISHKGAFAPADDAVMQTIEKPVIRKGRVFDPARDDEAVISPKFARRFHKGVGDTLALTLPAPAELVQGVDGTGPQLKGPHLTLRIVGIVTAPWFADSVDSEGSVVLSPGVVAQHRQNTVANSTQNDPAQVDALVRLRGGAAALPGFRAAVQARIGRADVDIWNLPEQRRHTQRQLAFEARCLSAFGLAAFLASLFLVGQTITRNAAASTGELDTMRAMGMSPRQLIAAAAAPSVAAGIVGTALATGLTAVASAEFPIGTAALFEPHPGVVLDWVVAGPGLALIPLLVALAAVGAAFGALRAARFPRPVRRSALATAAGRAGLPVPVLVGARFALEPGRGPRAVPVRPALVGAVVGVLGIIAALTFSSGVTDASKHRSRFGQTFGVGGFLGIASHDYFDPNVVTSTLAASSDVVSLADVRNGVATAEGGNSSVSLFTFRPGPKELELVVTSGRRPAAADEVLLADRTLSVLGVKIGSTVRLAGSASDGGAGSKVYTVTGTGLVPQGPHNAYSDGGFLTPEGYDRLFDGFTYHFLLADLRPGVRVGAVSSALARGVNRKLGVPDAQGFSLNVPAAPVELLELRQVRGLPLALGLFLVVLAVGAVGHALASAVRRRAGDIAVLRALGMTQRQSRGVLITQASVLALVGLIIGIPLGLAVGRSVWRVATDTLPVQYVSPWAGLALVLVAPVALVLAGVLAAVPGRRAARMHVAQILRTE